jgi:L-fuconolactonase
LPRVAGHPFPFVEPILPLLELAYEAFGPRRMMWGSDYPPVSGREGYANALRLTMDQFADKSEEDRALIFGGTAASIFRIDAS